MIANHTVNTVFNLIHLIGCKTIIRHSYRSGYIRKNPSYLKLSHQIVYNYRNMSTKTCIEMLDLIILLFDHFSLFSHLLNDTCQFFSTFDHSLTMHILLTLDLFEALNLSLSFFILALNLSLSSCLPTPSLYLCSRKPRNLWSRSDIHGNIIFIIINIFIVGGSFSFYGSM